MSRTTSSSRCAAPEPPPPPPARGQTAARCGGGPPPRSVPASHDGRARNAHARVLRDVELALAQPHLAAAVHRQRSAVRELQLDVAPRAVEVCHRLVPDDAAPRPAVPSRPGASMRSGLHRSSSTACTRCVSTLMKAGLSVVVGRQTGSPACRC